MQNSFSISLFVHAVGWSAAAWCGAVVAQPGVALLALVAPTFLAGGVARLVVGDGRKTRRRRCRVRKLGMAVAVSPPRAA